MSIDLLGACGSTTEVAEPPPIDGPWEALGTEAAAMASASGSLQTAVEEAAGSWARLTSHYDEPSTNTVVHRAMEPLVPRADRWAAAMAEAGAAVEDFAQQARQLQARAEALDAVRGEVVRAAAEIEAGGSWSEVWWQRLRLADFNAETADLRQEWERAQQSVRDRLAGIEREAGVDDARSVDVADRASLSLLAGRGPRGAGAGAGRPGDPAGEALVGELAGEDPEEILDRLDDEEAAAAAALADRRLDEQFTLPGSAARRMREVMAAHDHRTEAGMRAIRAAFLSLDEEQRRRLIVAYPAEFGNLNGIPLVMRARANAVRVAAMQHRVRAELGRSPTGDREQQRLEALRSGLEQAEERIAAGQAVVHLSARGRGEVVVMDGTPGESTERTLIHVPGTGADLSSLDTQVERVEALDGAAEQGTVSIYWQGAQMPADLLDNVVGLSPSFDLEAEVERGARNLAAFDRALDLEIPEEAHSTVSGHSAGAGYMGRAAHRGYGLTADALLYIAPAGPGRGVSSVEDLADPSTTVYRVESRDDAVDPARELLGWQGVEGRADLPWQDPMDELESIELEPGAADRTVLDDGELPELVSDQGLFAGHSGILDEDTHAVESIRAVVAGEEAQVLPLYRPGDPRLPDGVDDYEEAVRRRLLEDHDERKDWVSVEDLAREASTR